MVEEEREDEKAGGGEEGAGAEGGGRGEEGDWLTVDPTEDPQLAQKLTGVEGNSAPQFVQNA